MRKIKNEPLKRCGVPSGIEVLLLLLLSTPFATQAAEQSAQTPASEPASRTCESLAGKTLGGAVIVDAKADRSAGPGNDRCIVNGALHKTLQFRVALPLDWNGRLLYFGGGGWNGSISPLVFAPMPERSGYVVVTSDSGHSANGIDASWALGNPQAQTEFAFLSVHSVLEATKVIVHDYYGSAPHHSYFEGCSNGGREALISASRFPNDFDGVIARAPAYNWSGLFSKFLRNSQRQLGVPGAAVGAEAARVVEAAALEQCDALDGLADGIISNPESCQVRLESKRCSGAASAQCLTDTQMQTVQTFYSDLKSTDGTVLYPGWSPGGESEGWPVWLTGVPTAASSASGGAQALFADGFFKYWVVADPKADVLHINPEEHRPALALADTLLSASPDLRTFFALGHKVILWHGTSDWAISYRGSIQYFKNVAAAVGDESRRDESMEFFLAPGVQHCAGGAGADTVDLLTPLKGWVEESKRPSETGLVAKKAGAAGRATLSRPLCRYPAFPQYKGGDAALASSYRCEAR